MLDYNRLRARHTIQRCIQHNPLRWPNRPYNVWDKTKGTKHAVRHPKDRSWFPPRHWGLPRENPTKRAILVGARQCLSFTTDTGNHCKLDVKLKENHVMLAGACVRRFITVGANSLKIYESLLNSPEPMWRSSDKILQWHILLSRSVTFDKNWAFLNLDK